MDPAILLIANQKIGALRWSQIGHGRPRTDPDRCGRWDGQTCSDLRECGSARTQSDPAGRLHTATDQKVGGSNPSERAEKVQVTRGVAAVTSLLRPPGSVYVRDQSVTTWSVLGDRLRH